MGVDVAVGVERGEDVPVVGLGHFADSGVLAGEELVEEVSDGGGGDPLAGVDATLDEDAGLVGAEAQLHALDNAALVCLAGVDHLDLRLR